MRYSRQKNFLERVSNYPNNFQNILKNTKIAIIGCGGVGSVLCELLARGGFQNFILIDNDIIDESNIQRQIFYEKDIGKSKSKTLARHLKRINSKVEVKIYETLVDENNIGKLTQNVKLIIDCSDNFETREIINEYCERNFRDWIYNGAIRSEIVSCTFYGKDKKFKKVFPKKPINESCCDVGILSSTTFTSASMAYNQVLKYFLLKKENKLIKFDNWKNKFHEVKI